MGRAGAGGPGHMRSERCNGPLALLHAESGQGVPSQRGTVAGRRGSSDESVAEEGEGSMVCGGAAGRPKKQQQQGVKCSKAGGPRGRGGQARRRCVRTPAHKIAGGTAVLGCRGLRLGTAPRRRNAHRNTPPRGGEALHARLLGRALPRVLTRSPSSCLACPGRAAPWAPPSPPSAGGGEEGDGRGLSSPAGANCAGRPRRGQQPQRQRRTNRTAAAAARRKVSLAEGASRQREASRRTLSSAAGASGSGSGPMMSAIWSAQGWPLSALRMSVGWAPAGGGRGRGGGRWWAGADGWGADAEPWAWWLRAEPPAQLLHRAAQAEL